MEPCVRCKKSAIQRAVLHKRIFQWRDCFLLLFFIILYVLTIGFLFSRYDSEYIMPIFVGLTPVIFLPLILPLIKKRLVHGKQCTNCGYFKKDRD